MVSMKNGKMACFEFVFLKFFVYNKERKKFDQSSNNLFLILKPLRKYKSYHSAFTVKSVDAFPRSTSPIVSPVEKLEIFF
jgi:hypothetical protein